MSKTILIVAFIISTAINHSNACSIVCYVPNEIPRQTFVGEGIVTDIISFYDSINLYQRGLIELTLERNTISNLKTDKVTVSITSLGSMCEESFWHLNSIESTFSIGQKLSVIGNITKPTVNNIPNINTDICASFAHNFNSEMIPYDYKRNRILLYNAYNEIAKFQMISDTIVLNDSDRENWNRQEACIDNIVQSQGTTTVSEIHQVYIDLLNIRSTKSKSEKCKILESLIWTTFPIDNKLFENIDLTKKQRSKLFKKRKWIIDNYEM